MELNDRIHKWLHSKGIYDYDLCDGVVHVVGSVDLYGLGLTRIPVQFGYVSGYFSCGRNDLTSLEGCPSEVGDDFLCSYSRLSSLAGGPKEVGVVYDCSNNNLESLEGAPCEVGGDFDCCYNPLESLEGCPSEVGGDFKCRGNPFNVEPDVSGIRIGGEFAWK